MTPPPPHRAWWKEAIVYQLYPRSFQDSNGDGIGDLPGILRRLDYLQDLGVTMLWLNPIYASPQDDNGYDISDYYAIDPAYGTMEDFERLLAEAGRRGIRIMMDLVVNHSSDEHAWFQASRSSREHPLRAYYIWRPPRPDGGPPSNWRSFFGGSAWEFDAQTGEYYLHLFSKKQPDLNWELPELRQEIYRMMRWWLDKGLGGFRIDVSPFLSKDPGFPDFPDDFSGDLAGYYASGPRIHAFLREMNEQVFSRYGIATVGEGAGIRMEEALEYVGQDRGELQAIFHFDAITLDRDPGDFMRQVPYTLPQLKAVFARWDAQLAGRGWNSVFLGNHDFPRMLSRFGDPEHFRSESARLLATFLLSMRGTPYIYYGDEIGMVNAPFVSISEYRDIQTLNAWRELEARGDAAELEAFLRMQAHVSRDHGRTPMQWDRSPQAGFSTASPWIGVHPGYPACNAADQQQDPDSVLAYYRRMIRLRKSMPLLAYGSFTLLEPEHPQLFAYVRAMEAEQVLVLLNWSGRAMEYEWPAEAGTAAELLISTYPDTRPAADRRQRLRPWEGMLLRMHPGA
ncbi:MAG: alpha-glucosidase [Bacteroidia bacterium]|nr:alpha-glucosidase [Bacteroidia bacterium]